MDDPWASSSFNAPTGAWCSLTEGSVTESGSTIASQCTCRCVVPPDKGTPMSAITIVFSLNAPAGAWCSLTAMIGDIIANNKVSMHLQVRGAP